MDINELRYRVENNGKGGIDLEEIHELLDRLEAAEKERDTLRADLNTAKQTLEELIPKYTQVRKEHLLLRAKVAEMEKREPVAWTTKLALEYGASTLGFQVSGVNMWGEKGVPLHALPGAQGEEK